MGPMWWMATAALAAPVSTCARVFDNDAVAQAMDAADAAFREQDAPLFNESVAAMRERLPCVGQRLELATMIRVHTTEALSAFLAQDEPRLEAALGGLLDTDPEAVLDSELIPQKHPVREAFERVLERDTPPTLYLKKPESGWFEVNGKAVYALAAPDDVILQQIDGQGQVVETRWRGGGSSLGEWEGVAVAIDGTPLDQRGVAVVRREVKPQRILLGVGTGLALGATGALVAMASDAKSRALDTDLPLAESELARDEANSLSWGWIGTSVLSAGLAVAMVVTW